MVLISTRKKLTTISWYKYFGAKFSNRVRQGAQIDGLASTAQFKKKAFFLCDPSNTIMERVPRTDLFMYHQSTAPAPPPDLPPLVEPDSTEPVSATGPPPVVPAVVRHHVVPTRTAQMVLFPQVMCRLFRCGR